MSIELTVKYSDKVDELFAAESKLGLLTNKDYDWSGAHAVRIYKVTTASMNNYARNVYAGDEVDDISRYGKLYDLSATTEECILAKDRSFIFNVDMMDQDETEQTISAGQALARQLRNVVVPEVDTYVYGKIVDGAGTTAEAAELTAANIYEKILAGSEILDDNEVPETGRVLVVTPAVYTLLKQATAFDHTDVGADMRLKGVVGILDGMAVVKVPSVRLPKGVGFIIAHPCATTAPVKLEDYGVHNDTPLSSGSIVTGRIVYDAFVLDNKAKAIYVQPVTTE